MADQYCKPCFTRGHLCATTNTDAEGSPLCVFCEDRVPCPNDSKSKTAPATKPTAPAKQAAAPKEKAIMENRTCAGEGCNVPIGAKCTTGLCGKCYARKVYRDAHPPRPRKSRVNKPKPVVVVTEVNAAPEPTISARLVVSEHQLDEFILRLPLMAKEEMVNAWLAGH